MCYIVGKECTVNGQVGVLNKVGDFRCWFNTRRMSNQPHSIECEVNVVGTPYQRTCMTRDGVSDWRSVRCARMYGTSERRGRRLKWKRFAAQWSRIRRIKRRVGKADKYQSVLLYKPYIRGIYCCARPYGIKWFGIKRFSIKWFNTLDVCVQRGFMISTETPFESPLPLSIT